MKKIHRLPNPSDLKSDTVKNAGIAALITALISIFSMLAVFDVVGKDLVINLTAASAPASVALNWLCAFYRVNIKTELRK